MPGFRYSPEYTPRPSTLSQEAISKQLAEAVSGRAPLAMQNGEAALRYKAARRSAHKPMPGSLLA